MNQEIEEELNQEMEEEPIEYNQTSSIFNISELDMI